LEDFRIDFAAAAALIGFPQFTKDLLMSTQNPETPTPLAEISQGPSAFEQFLDNNQKNLIILTVLLVIGAGALVVYRGIEKSSQQSAGAALNKASDLPALQAVIQEHAGTQAAGSAMVLLAESQWSDGQQDAAIKTLRDFISSNADHAALPTAQASLGAKLMAQGKAADATAVFQQIVDNPKARFIAPYALISLGDIAQAAGDPDKAQLSYIRAKTDFPDSSFASTANERIASLRAMPPVEVEPPPAAAPEVESSAPTVVPVPTPAPETTPDAAPAETPAPETSAAETPEASSEGSEETQIETPPTPEP
jgi:predicted negative regulator of RcsB-dependent stress response